MPERRITTLKGLLRAAVDELLDRLLGETPPPVADLQPGRRYVMKRSVAAGRGGTLLKGSLVEFTGVKDAKGQAEIRVLDLPDDYEWEPERRLPYGPGFVLFVSPDTLGD